MIEDACLRQRCRRVRRDREVARTPLGRRHAGFDVNERADEALVRHGRPRHQVTDAGGAGDGLPANDEVNRRDRRRRLQEGDRRDRPDGDRREAVCRGDGCLRQVRSRLHAAHRGGGEEWDLGARGRHGRDAGDLRRRGERGRRGRRRDADHDGRREVALVGGGWSGCENVRQPLRGRHPRSCHEGECLHRILHEGRLALREDILQRVGGNGRRHRRLLQERGRQHAGDRRRVRRCDVQERRRAASEGVRKRV